MLREPSLAEPRFTAPQEIAALAMVYEALRLLGGSKLVLEIRSELAKVCRRSEVSVQRQPKGFEPPPFDDRYQHAFGIWTPHDSDDSLHEVCVELVREEVEQMQVNCAVS